MCHTLGGKAGITLGDRNMAPSSESSVFLKPSDVWVPRLKNQNSGASNMEVYHGIPNLQMLYI